MEYRNDANIGGANIQDAGSGGGNGGKIAVGGIGGVIILILSLIFGFNPGDVLGGGNSQDPNQPQASSTRYANCQQGSDVQKNRDCRFAAYQVAIKDYWTNTMKGSYKDAPLVTFSGSIQTGCGAADSSVGPFYCPPDQKVYLDTSFFDELTQRFGAKGGDAAEMYVVAHEYGHHVSNLIGDMDKAQQTFGQGTGPESGSVRMELEADCFAGAFMRHSADDPNSPVASITQDDVNRAADAAAAVGDDRIQQNTQGRVDREAWTHGSAAMRTHWLGVGFNNGPTACRALMDPNQKTEG